MSRNLDFRFSKIFLLRSLFFKNYQIYVRKLNIFKLNFHSFDFEIRLELLRKIRFWFFINLEFRFWKFFLSSKPWFRVDWYRYRYRIDSSVTPIQHIGIGFKMTRSFVFAFQNRNQPIPKSTKETNRHNNFSKNQYFSSKINYFT